jgi:hypothetical protein
LDLSKDSRKFVLEEKSSVNVMPLSNRHAVFEPPEWAEKLHSRAMMYFKSYSSSSCFNLSHADMAATLACVVRAGLFVENQDRQPPCLPLEGTQSVEMSIVSQSTADTHYMPALDSAHFLPQFPSSRRSSAPNAMLLSELQNSSESPVKHTATPSSYASPVQLAPSSISSTLGDPMSLSEQFETPMTPKSFSFSPRFSPSWTASDDAALQSLHQHPAHYPLLLEVFRQCWTSRIPGRQCLPSEEAAVVAAFVQNYPLPGTSAPDWEVSEFTGTQTLLVAWGAIPCLFNNIDLLSSLFLHSACLPFPFQSSPHRPVFSLCSIHRCFTARSRAVL